MVILFFLFQAVAFQPGGVRVIVTKTLLSVTNAILGRGIVMKMRYSVTIGVMN